MKGNVTKQLDMVTLLGRLLTMQQLGEFSTKSSKVLVPNGQAIPTFCHNN